MVVQTLLYQWLCLRLEALSALVAFFISAVAAATSGAALVPAGWVGVALTYSIDMTMFLKASVMMVAQVEGAFSSVERLRMYAHELPAEAPVLTRVVIAEGGAAAPPLDAAWPATGALAFRDVRMRYRDGPLVLKGSRSASRRVRRSASRGARARASRASRSRSSACASSPAARSRSTAST